MTAPAPGPAPGSGPSLSQRPPKVLVTKVGLGGHDRGSRLVAAFLRDAGISSLATGHLLMPQVLAALREAGLGHIKVVVDGIVPDAL